MEVFLIKWKLSQELWFFRGPEIFSFKVLQIKSLIIFCTSCYGLIDFLLARKFFFAFFWECPFNMQVLHRKVYVKSGLDTGLPNCKELLKKTVNIHLRHLP